MSNHLAIFISTQKFNNKEIYKILKKIKENIDDFRLSTIVKKRETTFDLIFFFFLYFSFLFYINLANLNEHRHFLIEHFLFIIDDTIEGGPKHDRSLSIIYSSWMFCHEINLTVA